MHKRAHTRAGTIAQLDADGQVPGIPGMQEGGGLNGNAVTVI